MGKQLKWLFTTALVALSTTAFAQGLYTTPAPARLVEVGGPQVTMDIRIIGPAQAEFTWQNAGANFLIIRGQTGTCPDRPKVKKAQDESGKGTACNLAYADDPEFFRGMKHCVSIAGPNTWAAIEDNRRYDTTKVACADVTGGTVSIRMGFAKRDHTYGLSPLLLKPDGTFVAWAWHAFGSTRYTLTRPNQPEPDLVTLVRVTGNGDVRAATREEAAIYNNDYACFFVTTGKCGTVAAK